MSNELAHARHRTYFLAASIGLAVTAIPGIVILLLEGSWALNSDFSAFYVLFEVLLFSIMIVEMRRVQEKE